MAVNQKIENKVFIINRSELEGRIDSSFYNVNQDYSNCVKLSKYAKVKGGKRIPLGLDYSKTETPYLYLRVSDMDEENEFNFSSFNFIDEDVFKLLQRYETVSKDIIISIAGTVGKVKLVNGIPFSKRVILTENCAKIVLNKGVDVLPEFFTLLFQTNFLRRQIELAYIQTTIPKLGIDKILSLKIPQFPDNKKQKAIIGKYQNAYTQKQQKEAQAKQLLESIDTYLLNELGIELQQQKYAAKDRIFVSTFREVVGNRIDPIYFNSNFSDLLNGKFNNTELYKVIQSLKSGIGAGKQDQDLTQQGIIQIRPTNIDEYGELKFDKNVYLPEENVYDLIGFNDVLFNNTNSQELVGKSAIFYQNTAMTFSNHITKISVDGSIINPHYLCFILNLYQKKKVFYSICTNWNNQSGVGLDLLKKLKIPLPPTSKQNDIVAAIWEIKNKSKQLQTEAISLLDNAKAEVEKMILGH